MLESLQLVLKLRDFVLQLKHLRAVVPTEEEGRRKVSVKEQVATERTNTLTIILAPSLSFAACLKEEPPREQEDSKIEQKKNEERRLNGFFTIR